MRGFDAVRRFANFLLSGDISATIQNRTEVLTSRRFVKFNNFSGGFSVLKHFIPGVAFVAALALAACGGGGGGGGGGGSEGGSAASNCPGAGSTTTAAFSLSTNHVSLKGWIGMSGVASERVHITITNPNVRTILVTHSQTWLSITPNPNGYADLFARTANLAAGTHCNQVNVAALDANQNVLASTIVAVTFNVAGARSSASSSSSSIQDSSSSSAQSSSASASGIAWNSYNGDLHPTTQGSLALANGSSGKFVRIGGSLTDSNNNFVEFMDYMSVSNGSLLLDSSAVANNRSLIRNNNELNLAPSYPRNMTFLTRVAPVAGVVYSSSVRMAEFELAFADARVRFNLRGDDTNNVVLSNLEEGVTRNAKLDMTVPHVFQLVVKLTGPTAGTVTLYVDGNDEPLIGPFSSINLAPTYVKGQDFIQFGDNSTSINRSLIDWMIWTEEAAYLPSALKGKLPTGLGVTTGY